ncbi:MAG TPA: PA domain-containing protein [Thermoanaerobaculia bacterium]|nr:PA domain-containing protein [Thermoanaerobaculia bacterium]
MKFGKLLLGSTFAATLALAPAAAHAAANIFIVNADGPNEGFNDPTPAAPVGGNPGTTLGQQRLNAFQFAADIWGSILESDAPIYILSSFDPLPCSATGGTLGAAGALEVWSSTPGAEIPGVWYHVALANKLAGEDLSPNPDGEDIIAFFNTDLDNPVCLGSRGWYYGVDNNHGTNVDLVTVLLHEFGHGLGFANFASEVSGTLLAGRPDIFTYYTLDTKTGKYWDEMTNAERVASAINSGKVVWDGINVTSAVPSVLAPGTPLLKVNQPSSLGVMQIGAAAFGPALTSTGVTGDVVLGTDAANAAGPSTTDGCSPITSPVAGKIALVDRGTCGFTVKVKNAQDAGAIAVLVADNAPGSPPAGLGGADPTVTIPSVRITLPDGNAIKAALGSGTVNVTFGLDLSVRAGANPSGKALLYAPNPVASGSSISHFDVSATPNLLMEPAINADLPHGIDLTLQQMTDIGWFSDADGVPDGLDSCIGSDAGDTIVIDSCDSGVTNTTFANGCRISDLIADCAEGAGNHGAYVSCVSHLTNSLKKNGTITGADKGAIQSCASGASIP